MFLIIVAVLGLCEPTQADGDDVLEDIAAILGAIGSTPHEHLERELLSLGIAAPDALFFTLAEGRLTGPDGVRLSNEQTDLLVRTLGKLGGGGLIDEVEFACVSGSTSERIAAMRVVGRAGRTSHLPLLLDAARGEVRSRELSDEFERALAEFLRRRPDAFRLLGSELLGLDRGLALSSLRGASSSKCIEANELLVQAIVWSDELRHTALAEIASLSPFRRNIGRDELTAAAAPFLFDLDPLVRQAAAQAVGLLRDSESVPGLIDLLEDDHPGVRDGAYWALRKVTGLTLRSDPEAWRRWYAAERSWFDRDCDAAFKRLLASDRAAVAETIRVIGLRTLYRDELAQRLARLLVHEQPGIRALAATVIGRFRSYVATQDLIDALDDSDELVQTAAWKALVRITGENLPCSSAAWIQFLMAQ